MGGETEGNLLRETRVIQQKSECKSRGWFCAIWRQEAELNVFVDGEENMSGRDGTMYVMKTQTCAMSCS